MTLVFDDEWTSTHAVITERKQSPIGACTRHRYGFVFTAVRGFRYQVIFGSLVPPRHSQSAASTTSDALSYPS